MDESSIHQLQSDIEERYKQHPTGCGSSFGEIVGFELQCGDQEEFLDYDESIAKNGVCTGMGFGHLAEKWGISTEALGELILDL